MLFRASIPALTALALVLLSGCGSSETGTSGTTTTTGAAGSGGGGTGGAGGAGGAPAIGGDRPVTMHVSSKYDPAKPAPLVVLLHGYGASGYVQETIYFKLAEQADLRGYIYAVPDGTVDSSGEKFWNATDACCDFDGTKVDDSAYLSGIVEEIKASYNIDPKRVYFVGHSNGAFMSYRMACDHADQIAAIVPLAGATFADDTKCKPSQPVAVAHIHGTADANVPYEGSALPGGAYPGAVETVGLWAAHDGCDPTSKVGEPKDLHTGLAGAETQVQIFDSGCAPGGHVELWTIVGGTHVPSVSDGFRTGIFDFFDAHPKP
jgi:polyhydroxybutyrate depolymerase